MDKWKEIWEAYKGAIIGVIVALMAIFLIMTNLYKVILAVILIVLGALGGYYIQQNKIDVKEKLKNFIDKF